MKTILLLTNSLSRQNGWSTVGFYVKNHFEQSRYRVLAAYTQGHDQGDLGISSPEKNYRAIPQIMDAYRLAGALKNEPIDTIICNVELLLPLAALVKKKLRIKKLLLIGHGTYAYFPFISGIRSRWIAFFTSSIDEVVAPSEYTRKKIQQWYDGNINIVKWGVDLSRYRPRTGRTKKKQFVFIGQLKERKGVRYLVRAFKELIRSYPQYRLVFIGDASASYQKLIASERIEDHVEFTGVIDHQAMVDILGESTCHVLPSVNAPTQFEGYGLVHLEANACGIPSIGSKGTANEEVIIDGFNGFLVNQKDPDDLRDKMEKIVSDPATYEKMCQNAAKHAVAHPWEKSIDQIIALEKAIVGK